MGQQAQQDKRSGQLNMFAAPASSSPSRGITHALPNVPELPDAELLKYEKELLGFYITSHPLTEHQSALENFSTASTKEAMACAEGAEVIIGGMINRVKKSVTKNGRSAGQSMAMITLEDLEGQIDGVLFADTYADILKRFPGRWPMSRSFSCAARSTSGVRRRASSSTIWSPFQEAAAKLSTMVALKLDSNRHGASVATSLEETLGRHKGNIEVYLQVAGGGRKVTMRLNKDRYLRPTQKLVDELYTLLGSDCVQLCGQGTRRRKKVIQQPLFQETDATTDANSANGRISEEDPLGDAAMSLED